MDELNASIMALTKAMVGSEAVDDVDKVQSDEKKIDTSCSTL